MSEVLLSIVLQRTQQTHGWLLKATEEPTADELARRLAPTATPIG